MEREEAISYVSGLLGTQRQIEELTRKAADLQLTIEQIDRTMSSYRKNINDEAQNLIHTRRENLRNETERSVRTAKYRLSQAEKKRSHAKDKQIKELVGEEVSGYKEEIQNLKRQIKREMVLDKVPFICNSRWFFPLHMPCSLGDYLLILLTAAFFVGLVPSVIYLLIPARKSWQFYVLFPVMVLLFTLIYQEIHKRTVGKHREILISCRDKRMQIKSLQDRIKKTKEDIVTRDDESSLSLGKQDAKLKKLQLEYDDALLDQTDKLREFEEVTRVKIIEEFRQKSEVKLDELRARINDLTHEKNENLEKAARLHLDNVDETKKLIGSQNMSVIRLEKILEALTDRGAASLEAAIYMVEHRKEEPKPAIEAAPAPYALPDLSAGLLESADSAEILETMTLEEAEAAAEIAEAEAEKAEEKAATEAIGFMRRMLGGSGKK